MSNEDCEDVFQNSFLELHQQIKSGKLVLTSSLSTYFVGICRIKAFEQLRANKRFVWSDDENWIESVDYEIQNDEIDEFLDRFDHDEPFEERKQNLVRQIVRELPHPCNELLWGFYRYSFSLKTLAAMFNYASETTIKVVKHSCLDKFRKNYNKSCKLID